MKSLFYLIILLILIASCKKDANKTSNEGLDNSNSQLHLVSFNVKDFIPEVDIISKGNSISDVPVDSIGSYLVYVVFDSNGLEVNRIYQNGSNTRRINREAFMKEYGEAPWATFMQIYTSKLGSIQDSLPSGQYTVVMIASAQDFGINTYNELPHHFYYETLDRAHFEYSHRSAEPPYAKAKDTFFKKFTINVGSEDFSSDVTLERIVGKVEINILDSKPNTTFRTFFHKEMGAFRFLNELPFGPVSDKDDNDPYRNDYGYENVEGKLNLSYSKYVINNVTPVDVIIECWENDILTATKTIKDVTFQRNKRTILTGNIYSSKKVGFDVNVNEKFDSDTVNINF